jgi:hypothetical protein
VARIGERCGHRADDGDAGECEWAEGGDGERSDAVGDRTGSSAREQAGERGDDARAVGSADTEARADGTIAAARFCIRPPPFPIFSTAPGVVVVSTIAVVQGR